MVLRTNKITLYATVCSEFSSAPYKSKSIKIANRFGFSVYDPDNYDYDSDVDVAK